MDFFSLIIMIAIAGMFISLTIQVFGRRGKERQQNLESSRIARKQALEERGIRVLPNSSKNRHMLWFVLVFTSVATITTLTIVDTSFYFIEALITTVALASVIGWILAAISYTIADNAESANRNWLSFFWLSLLISPLITWLVVAALKPERDI